MRTIGAYWYNRKMTLGASAKLLLEFISLLRSIEPILFSNWFEKGKTRKDALNKFVLMDYDVFIALIGKGNSENEFPEVAYRLSIWNGGVKDADSATLSATLGSELSQGFANNCVLKLPIEGDFFDKFDQPTFKKELVNLLVSFWQPDWVAIDGEKVYLNES